MQNEFAGVGSDLLAASAVSVDSFGRTVDGVRLLEDSDSDNVFDLDTDAAATMSYQYYADDLLKSVTDPRGNSTGYRYDALSRLSAVRGAAVVENRDHDTSASAPAFRTEQVYLYDSAHQLRFVIDPTGIVTESTYDHLGNLDQLQVYTDAVAGDGVLTPGTVTEKRDYDFDGFSRLVHEIRGDRNDSLFAGSASNDFSIHSSFYDQLGRVTVREEGIGSESGSTQLEYDNVHRTTKLIDPNQNETAWSYDDLGRVVSESIQIGSQANPTSVSRTYFYDSLSNLVQSVDRNGRLIRYDYDDLHLLQTERWYAPAANPSDPTDAGALQGGYDYDFDSLGRLKSVGDTAAEQLYQYRYDEGSRLVAELQTFAGSWTGGNQTIGFERDYDAYDNLIETRAFRGASFSISGQSIDTTTSSDDYVDTRLYDAQNRLESITRGADVADGIAALHVAFGYDNAGRQSRVNRYHGSDDSAGVSWNTVLDYDQAGRLTTITHSDPLDSVNPLSVYERVFSQAGAIESTTVTLGTTEHLTKTYSQDNRGQVISEAYFSGSSPSSQHTTRSYGPDAAGNRALEVIQSQTHHHTIERDNRLVSDSRWSYTHDDEGNVTSKTSADGKSLWQYAWDHRNRLIEATLRYDASGNVSATSSITRTVNQTYDGLDRWIGSENSETGENHLYVHDSGQLTLEFVDGAVENRYLWAAGVDQLLAEDGAATNEEPRWTLTDHLGSVRDVVSETTSLSHTDYDAFGNVEGTAADLLFGYTARPYDESTDLQNNHHRWYDSESGRWASQDPSGLEPDANPYRYVSNQPMTLTDPSGLEPPGLPPGITPNVPIPSGIPYTTGGPPSNGPASTSSTSSVGPDPNPIPDWQKPFIYDTRDPNVLYESGYLGWAVGNAYWRLGGASLVEQCKKPFGFSGAAAIKGMFETIWYWNDIPDYQKQDIPAQIATGVVVGNVVGGIVRKNPRAGQNDIALGIRADKGGMLEQFSEKIGAATMHRWKALGLYDDSVNGWGRAFMQTMNRTKARCGRAHFDVTGLDIAKAKAGNPASWQDSFTAFELRSILRRKDWFAMTDFYRNGVKLTPQEMVDLGIVPHKF